MRKITVVIPATYFPHDAKVLATTRQVAKMLYVENGVTGGEESFFSFSETPMKTKAELQSTIDQITSGASPVGMDVVYVHALILEQLQRIENRLDHLESRIESQKENAKRS